MANKGAAQLQVELIHAASSGRIWRQTLEVAAGSTIQQALQGSDFHREFPDISQSTLETGIYGQACSPDRIVAEGDRIEIYRPLRFDPMESRRRRAEHKRRQQAQSRKGSSS
ncbi:RnfH family protein [Paracandidimonas soli]|uniref:UPF0125 protein EV686_102478 n=1 Tax=Paracandidimonas soli TaxID=1917182 RepID=A0A4R3VG04_9BURK|nr:RnfH family protein [Paracandidimonas soli]TCV01765.1 hypothetical protein EV686_102478 [Paracandidimonas soli]